MKNKIKRVLKRFHEVENSDNLRCVLVGNPLACQIANGLDPFIPVISTTLFKDTEEPILDMYFIPVNNEHITFKHFKYREC